MYYAFYAPSRANSGHTEKPEPAHWSGEVELRGLASESYHVMDYVQRRDLGTVTGPVGKIKVDFVDNLLLDAAPAP
jgi:hypothetical protein